MNSKGFSWGSSSLLYRLIGILAPWRASSWLLEYSEGLGALLIALVLVLGPFVTTTLIGVLLLAVAIYWLLLTLSDQKKISSGLIDKLVLLYWSIATVATAFSPVKSAALAGWVKLTLYLLMFALCSRILRSSKLSDWLITCLLNISLIVSVYGVRQQLFGADPLATWNDPNSALAQDTRVYSYLGNPNLLAGYLLPAIALSLGAIFVWRGWLPKFLAVTMFIVNSSCLFFTDSRGGWLAMVGLLATFLLLIYYWYYDYLPQWWRRWLLPIVGGAIALTILVAFWQVESIRLRILSIFAGREDSSNNFRINVWTAVIDMIRTYPILGIGPGNEVFNQVYPLFMVPNYTALGAYSIFLETAVETGLVGFSCFLGLIGVIFYRGVYHLPQLRQIYSPRGFWLMAAIAAIVGLLIQGLVDTVWYRPQVNTLWWFLVGLIASFDMSVQGAKE